MIIVFAAVVEALHHGGHWAAATVSDAAGLREAHELALGWPNLTPGPGSTGAGVPGIDTGGADPGGGVPGGGTGGAGTGGGVPGIDLRGGEAPPGSEKINLLLRWVFWGVSAACVGGLLFAAGKMALNHSRGEGSENAKSLGWVALACVLAGSATGLIGALL